MNQLTILPAEFQSVVGSDKVDFCVKTKRKEPMSNSISLLIFGIVWSSFISIFVYAFFGPLFREGKVSFKVNGNPTTGSWDNIEPLIVPGAIISLFVIVGVFLIISGVFSLLQKGGHFIGTEHRLINYRNGTYIFYDWEQFTGNMEINQKRGEITFLMRTGKMKSRKDKPDEFVPDQVYISGVSDVLIIEELCQKRIKENDPTPAKREITS